MRAGFLYVTARLKSPFGQNLMFRFPKGPLKSEIMSFIHFLHEVCKNGDTACCNADEPA